MTVRELNTAAVAGAHARRALLKAAATSVNAKAYDDTEEKFTFCLDLLDLSLVDDGDTYSTLWVESLERAFDRILEVEFLVRAVRRHADKHYDNDGWDILVECWSDDEIAEVIGGARITPRAILKVRAALKPLAGHRSEIEATAF